MTTSTRARVLAGAMFAGLVLAATFGAAQAQTVEDHTNGPKARVLAITGGLPPAPPTPTSAPAGR